ncbi:MAG TPA: methylthioribulose 1-phosphate dehydratase [Pyrinomonadaceae bacterium]|nr:methylthioribulose 1-phosphate dehydratase [Pyrinomonadaceae bacterium]
MAEDFAQIASDLVATATGFHARGWVLGTSGNLSAVVNREPLQLAMSPSGVDKGSLRPEQILLIDEQSSIISNHRAKPSAESPLHVRVAKERGAGAVFHTHSVWSTILSDIHAAAGGVAIEGYEMLKGLDGVQTHEHREWLPILENSQDMSGLADRVAETLRQNPAAHALLLRGHGLYTWGRNPAEARRHVEILEFLLEVVGRRQLAGM